MELTPYVEQLQQLFEFTARFGGQDYEVASLYFGLQYLNKHIAAEFYAVDYVLNRRRDKLPLPNEWDSIGASISEGRQSPVFTARACCDMPESARKEKGEATIVASPVHDLSFSYAETAV